MVSYLIARSTFTASRSGAGSAALAFGASRRSGVPGGAATVAVNAARPKAAAKRKRFIASLHHEKCRRGYSTHPDPGRGVTIPFALKSGAEKKRRNAACRVAYPTAFSITKPPT